MVAGFTVSKDDCPSADEHADIIEKVNKGFKKSFTTFEQVTNYYRSMVSSLGWMAKIVAPVISLAVSMLGRVMHAWRVRGGEKSLRVHGGARPARDHVRHGDTIEHLQG
jgi:hypothetical protein